MAETSLRAYVKEIDELIEREQLDEAIAHSRYILESYPKHLEVYRLLGKAYLEAKRYGDAADIFQRVLSAAPDDFVAHIGMAIVREDEGNLDSGIWHMERAFETNPANPAVQQELRRMIGKRDGLEPHKVRLTRGALARMYAQGELYPQAIAELRAALQEDPERPDLQALLAEMYYRMDMRAEAVEVCQHILEKLPYSREANRLMAAVLQASGKVEEAAGYHRKLAALDPYAAFLETAMSDLNSVDPGAIRIERLSWHPGLPLPAADAARMDWAASLTQEASKIAEPVVTSGEQIPSWLQSLEASEPEPAPAKEAEPGAPVHPFAGTEPPGGAEIPDWMREAGWQEATGEAVEGPVSFTDQELAGEAPLPEAPPGELAPAEIPDWLRQIAPSEAPAEAAGSPPAPAPRAEVPDWLEEVSAEVEEVEEEPPGPRGFGYQFEAPSEPEQAEEPAREVPTWLQEPADGATETIVTWLGKRRSDSREVEQAREEPAGEGWAEPAAGEEVPSWAEALGEQASGEEPPPPAPGSTEPLPSWLAGVAEAAAQEEPFLPEELPRWGGPAEEIPAAEESLEEPAAPIEEPEPWRPEFLEEEPAAPGQAVPEWLRGIASEDEFASGEPAAPGEPVPDWLKGIAEPAAAEPPIEAPADWMEEAEEEQPATFGMGSEAPAPDWLRGMAAQPVEPAEARGEIDWGEDLPVEEAEPADLEAEEEPSVAAPDWLTRGVGEPEAGTIAANVPTWLEDWAAQSPEDAAESAFGLEAEPRGAEEVPGWLSEFGDAAGEMEEEAITPEQAPWPPQRAAPDWLRPTMENEPTADFMAEETAETPLAEEPAAADLTPTAEEDVFRWLEDLAARQETGTAEELPAGQPLTPELAQTPAWGQEALPEEAEEGIEWLERLAEESGTASISERAPAEADLGELGPGEWLREMALEDQGLAGAEAETPEAAAELGELEEADEPVEAASVPLEWPAEPAELSFDEADQTALWVPDEQPAAAQPAAEEPIAEPPPPQAPPPEPPRPVFEEAPDWLREVVDQRFGGLAEAAAEQAQPEAVEPAAEEPALEFAEPSITPEAEAAEWPAETPASAMEQASWDELPEPSIEEPGVPDWLTQAEAAMADEPRVESAEPEIPDWLAETVVRQPAARAPEPTPVEPELPEWLMGAEAEGAPREIEEQRTAPGPAETAPEPPAPRAEVPAARVAPAEEPVAQAAPEPPPPPAKPVRPEADATVVSRPAAKRPPKAAREPSEALLKARHALASGALGHAASQYGELIRRGDELDLIIEDLTSATRRHASSVGLWRTLGDAYKKAGRVQEALKAYERGMEETHVLDNARRALRSGDIERAATEYGVLIKRKLEIGTVITELRDYLESEPQVPVLWQILGDAYMKADRLPEAIEAYRRGMEVA